MNNIKSENKDNIKFKENMEQEFKKSLKKKLYKILKIISIIGVVFIIFKIFLPEKYISALNMSGRYAKEMITIFPAVILLMGLADVWIPTSLVKKYLGENSGFKGKLLAIILGTLPAGPMYVAFPLAAEMLRKKASISNIIVFLGVWGSMKIPQIGVEIKFLGLKFAGLRFIFTLVSVLLMGVIVDKMVNKKEIRRGE